MLRQAHRLGPPMLASIALLGAKHCCMLWRCMVALRHLLLLLLLVACEVCWRWQCVRRRRPIVEPWQQRCDPAGRRMGTFASAVPSGRCAELANARGLNQQAATRQSRSLTSTPKKMSPAPRTVVPGILLSSADRSTAVAHCVFGAAPRTPLEDPALAWVLLAQVHPVNNNRVMHPQPQRCCTQTAKDLDDCRM